MNQNATLAVGGGGSKKYGTDGEVENYVLNLDHTYDYGDLGNCDWRRSVLVPACGGGGPPVNTSGRL